LSSDQDEIIEQLSVLSDLVDEVSIPGVLAQLLHHLQWRTRQRRREAKDKMGAGESS